MKKPKKAGMLLDEAAGAAGWAHDEGAPDQGLAESAAPDTERPKFAWSKKSFAFASQSGYGRPGKGE